MGVGEFLLLSFITLCLYSLINKGIKIFEYMIKNDNSMREINDFIKSNATLEDFKEEDFK